MCWSNNPKPRTLKIIRENLGSYCIEKKLHNHDTTKNGPIVSLVLCIMENIKVKAFVTTLLIMILSSPLFAAPTVTIQTATLTNPFPFFFSSECHL